MMAYSTQFAATGNPNRDDLPAWPELDPTTDQHLTLGDTVTIADGLHHGGAAVFKSFDMSRRRAK